VGPNGGKDEGREKGEEGGKKVGSMIREEIGEQVVVPCWYYENFETFSNSSRKLLEDLKE
jgi:hypothetical protein